MRMLPADPDTLAANHAGRLTGAQAAQLLRAAWHDGRLALRALAVVVLGAVVLWLVFRAGALRNAGGAIFAGFLALVVLIVAQNGLSALWRALLRWGDAAQGRVAYADGAVRRERRFGASTDYYCLVGGLRLALPRAAYDALQEGQTY